MKEHFSWHMRGHTCLVDIVCLGNEWCKKIELFYNERWKSFKKFYHQDGKDIIEQNKTLIYIGKAELKHPILLKIRIFFFKKMCFFKKYLNKFLKFFVSFINMYSLATKNEWKIYFFLKK